MSDRQPHLPPDDPVAALASREARMALASRMREAAGHTRVRLSVPLGNGLSICVATSGLGASAAIKGCVHLASGETFDHPVKAANFHVEELRAFCVEVLRIMEAAESCDAS